MEDKKRNTSEIDEELSRQAKEDPDIGQFTIELEVIQTTYSEICKPPNTEVNGKTIPWWTESLKIMRKRTNALRKRYQRTTTNEEQRENRKPQYTKAKKEYQAAIKREKIRSWKQHCTTTSPNNPWNEIYKLANNKTRSKQIITIRKPDGKNRNNDRNTPTNHGPTDSGGQTQRRHALPQDNSGPNKTTTVHNGR